MNPIEQLTERRDQIVREIAQLAPMRRGTVGQQYLTTVHRDGSKTKRGPYSIYTFKQKGKTVSRRLTKREAKVYGQQVEAFRRFQQLSAELVEVSQRLADLTAGGRWEEKKRLHK